jgi:hypothetical protein
MAVALSCIERGHEQEAWTLAFAADAAEVRGPGDRVMGRWEPADAARRLRLDEGLGNLGQLAIAWDNGRLRFDVSPDGMNELRAFLHHPTQTDAADASVSRSFSSAFVSSGHIDDGEDVALRHEEHSANRNAAVGAMFGGLIVCGVGVAITMGTYHVAAAQSGGGHYVIAYGAIISGAISFMKGAAALMH